MFAGALLQENGCAVACIANPPAKLRRQSHPGCVSHDREQALAGARVVEPLDCRSQTVLRDADANLARGDLFHRVGFVENDEVVWKKITAFPLCLLVRTSQKHE